MRGQRSLVLAMLCALAAGAPYAQESSSRGDAPAPVSGPTAALRDVLTAACSHDEVAFEKFLTARNMESFSRLTVAARTELMKRFVLLSDPGKPAISANPAGRPILSCATAYGTAEIQIGGADSRDAVAFLPVDLREASDPDTGAAHHVLFGMVREDGQWKVLSIGLLLLDLPSLEVEWDQAEISSSERQARSPPCRASRTPSLSARPHSARRLARCHRPCARGCGQWAPSPPHATRGSSAA